MIQSGEVALIGGTGLFMRFLEARSTIEGRLFSLEHTVLV